MGKLFPILFPKPREDFNLEEHVLTQNLILAGYPMAKNLRAKIPKSDKLVICDRNPAATKSFIEEAGAGAAGDQEIEVAKTPRSVVEQAVSELSGQMISPTSYDEHVLSMI